MTPDAPVGIIGLGLMGIALSARLIDAKIPLIGFDIEPVRCGIFKASGGMVATSVHELAARCRTIIIAVYSGEQVEALFDEIVNGAGNKQPVVICTTTCGPAEIERIAARASAAGLALVEARQSAAYSRVMDTKGEKMLTQDFRPQSHLAQTLKDAELIIAEAGRCGLRLPVTTTQAELLRAAIRLEGADRDSAAVIEAIRWHPDSSRASR